MARRLVFPVRSFPTGSSVEQGLDGERRIAAVRSNRDSFLENRQSLAWITPAVCIWLRCQNHPKREPVSSAYIAYIFVFSFTWPVVLTWPPLINRSLYISFLARSSFLSSLSLFPAANVSETRPISIKRAVLWAVASRRSRVTSSSNDPCLLPPLQQSFSLSGPLLHSRVSVIALLSFPSHSLIFFSYLAPLVVPLR